jgi:hypothetical protein
VSCAGAYLPIARDVIASTGRPHLTTCVRRWERERKKANENIRYISERKGKSN